MDKPEVRAQRKAEARAQHKGKWTDEELAQLAEAREARFQRRKARIEADPTLHPKIKALYLDRTIVGNTEAGKELGMTPQRVTHMRGGRPSSRRPWPHPSVFPWIDVIIGYLADVPQPGTEIGAIREWAVKRGTHWLNRDTGKMRKARFRSGRPRSGRLTLSKQRAPSESPRRRSRKKPTNPEG